ncbi:MAG: DegT/DnrJ/EryC1/StrS aminotransferase family protein [Crenarchaeota archaeon]|nr:MAG: DegT/DnrJ/EryC1/StrS aminotransferase family protein [Thermoproteota archaeon]RDJ38783.1 MAG: DegT/DnrJ/EryC1/StrS aminotransferase family protein [Thermoproteota archaeon]
MMNRIPVFIPAVGKDTKKHLSDALDAGWLGMGDLTKKFEDEISIFLGLKNRFVVTTNTGTSALHIGLKIAGVGKGDEVITPSFNYVADHQSIKMTGAEVVMCDICDDNLGIDCKKAEELITEKTKAIIPLHFAGIPCNQNEVFKLAKKYGLRVVEDAMHAMGSHINGKKIGSYGDITCFSFDPVKVITSIDGGCVIINNKEELERAQHLRILGVDKDTIKRYQNKRSWDYDVVGEGYRYHLTNIMASVGLSQIKKINQFIHSRQRVCQMYNQAFDTISELKIPKSDFSEISPFIYTLRVLNDNREGLIKHLDRLEIDVGIHFIPVHKHTYFVNSRCGDMTTTEKVVKEVLTLPLHSNMKKEYVQRVIDGVTSYFN